MRKTSPPVTALPLSHCSSSTRVFRAPHACAKVCLPISRQHLFTGCQAASRNACGIHGGRNPLPAKRTAGISRRAAKPGFFPQKALLPRLCARGKRNSLPAISTPRFEGGDNPPAGRPRTFASYQSAIFMGHSVRGLSAPARPADAGMLSVNWQRPPKAGGRKAQDCGRERACNLAPKAQPVAPGGERGIHSSRPPDGGEKAFLVPFGA